MIEHSELIVEMLFMVFSVSKHIEMGLKCVNEYETYQLMDFHSLIS